MLGRNRLLGLCTLSLLVASACATSPDLSPEERAEQPEWVLGSPPTSSDAEYFVGRGVDAGGSRAAAEDEATAALVSEITRYLGVTIRTESTAVAEASLEDFTGRVTRTVEQHGTARIEGLRIEDRFVEVRDGRVEIHLLARYDRDALERERARLTALFEARIEAVEAPMRTAFALEAEGDYVKAAQHYLRAAAAAAESEIDGMKSTMPSSLRRAEDVLSSVRMRPVADDPMTAQVYAETAEGTTPLSGVPVSITHPVRLAHGRTGIGTTRASTDASGRVTFALPDDTPPGSGYVRMGVSLSSELDAIPVADGGRELTALRTVIRDLRVRFPYDFALDVSDRSIAVVVVERDRAGNPLSESRAATSLTTTLERAGYVLVHAGSSPGVAADMSDREIVDLVLGNAPSVELVIVGRTAITEFEERNGMLARVDGDFSVIETGSNRVLGGWSGFTRSSGGDSVSTISAAFRRIGEIAGYELMRRLE